MSDRSPSQSAVSNTSETLLTDRSKRRKTTSKRSHAKTRTGCKTCKRRKIKASSTRRIAHRRTATNVHQWTDLGATCDEQRPSCSNCLKHGVDCEFLAESSVYPNFFTNDEAAPALNMLDLQLMHHFTTSTYATLFCHPPMRHFWRGGAIQMGLRCDYVMRAIFAISALHLAHHSPERRELYTSTALTYHRIASRQAMSLMSDMKEENASNLFVFSVLTIFFALGGPSQPSNGMLLFGESSFPEWLFLLQGTKSLIEMLGPAGNRGPLDPFLSQIRWSPLWTRSHLESETESAMKDALDELEMQVSASVNDPDALRVYRHAIKELRMVSVSFFDASQVDITDLFTWIYLVLDDFLPLLKVPTQESVAIFSHFCVLLHKLGSHWWIQGWGHRLIRRAYKILDNEHKLWITWPIEEMGCVLST